MLSDDLKSLANRYDEYRHTGVQLPPAEVVALVQNLDAATEQVRALELAQIAPAVRLVDLPDNVIRLATALHRQGVRVGPRPICEPDGAA